MGCCIFLSQIYWDYNKKCLNNCITWNIFYRENLFKFQELFSFSTKVCGTFRDHSLNVKSRKYILLDTAKKSYVLSACVIRTRNFGFYVLLLIIILTGEFEIHNDIKYQVSNSFWRWRLHRGLEFSHWRYYFTFLSRPLPHYHYLLITKKKVKGK